MSFLRPDWRTRQLAVAAAFSGQVWRGISTSDEPEVEIPLPADLATPPKRRCTRLLPDHPVELHADETRCWKCWNTEIEVS